MTLRDAGRYFETFRHLRPIQILYRLRRAVRGIGFTLLPGLVKFRLYARVPASPTLRNLARVDWPAKPLMAEFGMFEPEQLECGVFRFLNRQRTFAGSVQWNNPDLTYLWDFNLHYFEFIHCVAARPGGPKRVLDWIRDWIEHNPYPSHPGWHPYPVSLRTIQWIKFLMMLRQANDSASVMTVSETGEILRSLYAQLLYLEANLEKHLMANHYLENGRALVFGGCFFAGPDADRWYNMGSAILSAEIAEEFLPHGGHYERSPMYHCILLEGLLETARFLEAAGRSLDWMPDLRKMCDWLWKIRTPTGWYPLFNDAAYGISAPPDHLLEQARLQLRWQPPPERPVQDCDRVYVMRTPSWYCAVDGAEIGPAYNPGHAHSDNFTYEAFYRQEPLIVDTGTSHYDKDARRQAQRITGAHNTVLVNGVEQSDVWGGFRVASRSNPQWTKSREQNGALIFEGEYFNRVSPRLRIRHRRTTILEENLGLIVVDTVTGIPPLEFVNHVHLAPGWSPESTSYGFHLKKEKQELRLIHTAVSTVTLRADEHCPQFGLSIPTQTICFNRAGGESIRMAYALTAEPFEQIRIGTGDAVVLVDAGGNETACAPSQVIE